MPDQPTTPIAIAIAGAGPEAETWTRALRGVDGVDTARVAPGEDELLAALSRPEVAAVAFVPPLADLPGLIRRAVIAGRHVLVAGPAALASKQLHALDDLARRRERAIVFATDTLADERFAFVRKMTGGPQGLWRPRYVRSLRTGVHGRATLDELAVADLATVLSLVGGVPSSVAACSPRVDDEAGAADVAMVTVAFAGGPVARVDVSLVEPWLRQEIIVACDGRTVVLDALDPRAPLQIHAATRHRGPADGQWAETISEHPVGDTADRMARLSATFVRAVRGRDASVTNARDLALAATVWELARESMALGGDRVDVSAPAAAARPVLQLIHGGGRRIEAAAPALTVVQEPRPA